MIITDNELTLRNAKPQDAAILGSWWRDGKVMAHAGFPNGLNITDDEILAQIQQSTGLLIIEHTNEPIGEMSFRNKGNQTAEIGIKICVEAKKGEGLGTRSLKMLIAYLFNELKFERIILDTNVKNIAAQRTYTALGFKEVQVRQDAWIDQLGQAQSAIDYELVPANFRG